jgi:two-component system, chemotaxis family, CheB/CheR fusion protein
MPSADRPSDSAPDIMHGADSLPLGRLRGLAILLVEDDALSREALELIFSYYGAIVSSAASVDEALRAYERTPPSILVSDIGLAGGDGCTLIEVLRRRERGAERRTPAIALSGFPGRETGQRARHAGFDAFLRKPVEIHVLLALVAELALPAT